MEDQRNNRGVSNEHLIQELTNTILSHNGLTVDSFGRHWRRSILPGWIEDGYHGAYLQSIAEVVVKVNDTNIRIDTLNYRLIIILRDLLAEGLVHSFDRVLYELHAKQVGVPISTSPSEAENGDEDVAGIASPTSPLESAMDVDSDVNEREDPDDYDWEPIASASRRLQRPRRRYEPETEEEGDDVWPREPVIHVADEDRIRRFLGRLPPDDPVWEAGETAVNFPGGLQLVPLSLAHPQMSRKERKDLTAPVCGYLVLVMVHQIRPGYSTEWRAKIANRIRKSDPREILRFQPYFDSVQRSRGSRSSSWDSSNETNWPRLVDLEACLHFLLFKLEPGRDGGLTDLFCELGLGEMLNYGERLIIDDYRRVVTLARTGRVLPVCLDEPRQLPMSRYRHRPWLAQTEE